MRVVLSVAVAALLACAIVPYYTNQFLTSEASTAALAAHRSVPARPQVKPDVSASRSVIIAPGSGGHFRVAGRNGAMRVAPVELGMVEIDDLEVHNVAAVVLPPGVLSESLLGLSFLSRLRRFEYADGKLVLEQ